MAAARLKHLGGLLMALAMSGVAIAQPLSPAARVNGVAISVERLERNFDELLRDKGLHIAAIRNPVQVKRLKREALDALIDQELLWQEAQRAGVQVPAPELDAAVTAVRSGFSSEEAFVGRLRVEGFTPVTYADHLRRLLAARKVLDAAGARVVVGDDELQAFYDANQELFRRDEQSRLRHLYLPFRDEGAATPGARDAARARMAEIQARLAAGSDFEALAREHSKGSSAASGGDIGWVRRDELALPLAQAAFGLRPGQVSDVVEMPDGLHLFRCDAYRPAEVEGLDRHRDELKAHLEAQKGAASRQALLQRLHAAARIELLIPLPPVTMEPDEPFAPAQRARAMWPGTAR